MSTKKVMIVQPINENGIALLRQADFEVVFASSFEPSVVAQEIKNIDGVIVRTAPFTSEIINNAENLKVIARHGVGVDNIDLEAASRKGIYVVNTPNANKISVAEHTIAFILALSKRLKKMDQATRAGHFGVREEYSAIDLEGKTLGVVGLGRIGATVAKRCQLAFNMRVLAHDPYCSSDKAQEAGAKLVDLTTLLQEADFVTLHAPLTRETENMIGRKELETMKPSAFIINVARGPLWDEDALVMALKEGWIAGAATDVFKKEPPSSDHPFLRLENMLLSPHMAALTKECVIRMAKGAAQGVIEVLSEQKPTYLANRELLQKYGFKI
ncbi:MAG: D-3-phosphoglycerate dehydrogenase / 2-oxoglutarate reductase [Candidatus Atribacteria bacterium]|nr:D-3-phosphoglycerate dehydrogenase / 2-oxoglutarate reductase [Candidatus Atribacteria bacterium]